MIEKLKNESVAIKFTTLFISLYLLAASVVAGLYTEELPYLFENWWLILSSPCVLVTDYFLLGGLPAALFNAGVCGLACALMILPQKYSQKGDLAGFFLVIAHCFYGLNFFNMWPPIIGILCCSRISKLRFRDNLSVAMFSTAFGPFFSELVLRYPCGIAFAIALTFFIGIAVPALLPGAQLLHRGYNLYNAGLAFGILGLLISSFMYKTLGFEPQKNTVGANQAFLDHNSSFMAFADFFFIVLFCIFIALGYTMRNTTRYRYRDLLSDSGYKSDFFVEYGTESAFMNIGVYGLMMLAYMNFVMLVFKGAGFTGPSFGVMFAAITFSASGQHPRIVWPILAGYLLLFGCGSVITMFMGTTLPWVPSTQGYINAVAFATGLCPFAGKFNWKAGVLAGFISAVLCTSTASIHAGLVLYNGGFTAGLTAMILLPFYDLYGKKNQ